MLEEKIQPSPSNLDSLMQDFIFLILIYKNFKFDILLQNVEIGCKFMVSFYERSNSSSIVVEQIHKQGKLGNSNESNFKKKMIYMICLSAFR